MGRRRLLLCGRACACAQGHPASPAAAPAGAPCVECLSQPPLSPGPPHCLQPLHCHPSLRQPQPHLLSDRRHLAQLPALQAPLSLHLQLQPHLSLTLWLPPRCLLVNHLLAPHQTPPSHWHHPRLRPHSPPHIPCSAHPSSHHQHPLNPDAPDHHPQCHDPPQRLPQQPHPQSRRSAPAAALLLLLLLRPPHHPAVHLAPLGVQVLLPPPCPP
mmetsp:Transcript_24123/g.66029  ORF Transcript_24123/g.66029 Transcript_24123/m.66029 type:complete len:213 (-) Transcript_24123:226-864(-)